MDGWRERRTGPPVRRRRVGWTGILAGAAALMMALAGPVTAQAVWMTSESTVTASASSGRLTFTLSDFSALATTYSSGALTMTGPITVTNTGTVPSPYTLTFGVQASTALAAAVDVRVWPVTTAAGCTAATPAAGASGASWTTVDAVTGTLAPTSAAYYCVRSSVSQAERFALVGGTTTATATLVAAQGSWTSTTSATATQSVANTLTPGQVTKSTQSDASISIAWTAPADTVAVTGYRVYRDGVLVATVPVAQRSYVDTGLSVLKSYSYTVAAIDSATPVNVSPTSAPASLATSGRSTTAWYRVTNAATGQCVDAEGGTPANGTPLISYSCNGGNNQAWRFAVSGSYFKVTAKGTTSPYWDSPNDRVALRGANTTARQLWSVNPIAAGSGTFTLTNRNGQCLDVTGATSAGGNRQLTMATCVSGSVNQAFVLTNAG